MSRYQFELASASDDFAIRQVMANTPMPGSIELSFQHEPSYFESNQVLGPRRETIVCRNTDGSVVGVATRSVRKMYVGNRIRSVGYLGGLRFAPQARNRGLLAGGFRFLKQLHDSDPAAPDYYLTTIADDNQFANRILTSGRAGLPSYLPVCRLHTFALPVRTGRSSPFNNDTSVDWKELGEFLNQTHRRTHFPAYSNDDFDGSERTFRGLNLDSIVTIREQEKLVGVAGVWDQRAFRQTVVTAYSKLTGLLRPAINQWARFAGGVRLPPVNDMLKAVFACFPVVANDDPRVFTRLIQRLIQIAPSDCSFLLIGHCDGDPLMPTTRKMSRTSYVTQLFAVSWDGKNQSAVRDCQQPHYLELGCL